MKAIKDLNLLLSFLLELAMLFFYSYWAYNLTEQVITKYALAIIVPAIAVVAWGIWAAPKSKNRLRNPARAMLKLTLLLVAGILCFITGKHGWAFGYAGFTLLNAGLAYGFGQDY